MSRSKDPIAARYRRAILGFRGDCPAFETVSEVLGDGRQNPSWTASGRRQRRARAAFHFFAWACLMIASLFRRLASSE